MSDSAVLYSIGAIFVLVALVGGIKSKWIEFLELKKGIRIASIIVGIIFIFLGYRSSPSPAPPTPIPSPPSEQSTIDVKGKVIDIFGNPREDVIVIARGLQSYAITDNNGEYHLSDIPFQKNITIEAHYGNEKDDINLDKYNPGEVVNSTTPLILRPITIQAVLARNVVSTKDEGLIPKDPYEEESPRIRLRELPHDREGRNREVWCFVKIIGPLNYEIDKETELIYEWYFNNEIQGEPFKQQVGISPSGWRTRASKKVWTGEWSLIIKTELKELACIHFEIL